MAANQGKKCGHPNFLCMVTDGSNITLLSAKRPRRCRISIASATIPGARDELLKR